MLKFLLESDSLSFVAIETCRHNSVASLCIIILFTLNSRVYICAIYGFYRVLDGLHTQTLG